MILRLLVRFTITVLHYTKTDKFTHNKQHLQYEKSYINRRYKHKDTDGRLWMAANLTAKGLSGGGYEYEYKGKKSLWVYRLRKCKS